MGSRSSLESAEEKVLVFRESFQDYSSRILVTTAHCVRVCKAFATKEGKTWTRL